MKRWGKNRNLILAKNEITVEEAMKYLDRFKDGKVYINLSVSGEEPGTWEKMVEVNEVTAYKLQGDGHKYSLNFKDKIYLCDGDPIYMTDSEARAIYFILTSDTVLDNFGDIVMNMRRRYKHKTILDELWHDELTVVEKK